MSIKLQNFLESQAENAGPKWHTVEVSEGKNFDVELHPPDFQDRIRDAERGYCSLKRITAHVRNWRNVLDEDGEELPFSHRALLAVCEVSPIVLRSIIEAVDGLYDLSPAK